MRVASPESASCISHLPTRNALHALWNRISSFATRRLLHASQARTSLRAPRTRNSQLATRNLLLLCVLCGKCLFAQEHSAANLYRQLQTVTLDQAHLYRIRDAQIEREDLHLSLDEGVIAFTYAIDGRVTGAFFQGAGEVLLSPPDRVERASLELFTGAAILDERFTTAYLRFNDDTKAELEPALRTFNPAECASEAPEENGFDTQAFLDLGNATSTSLAPLSSLRMLTTFVNAETMLPDGNMRWQQPENDHFLHARVAGGRLGVFDLFFDSLASGFDTFSLDQVTVAHDYDVWTSFPARSLRARVQATKAGAPPSLTARTQAASEAVADPVAISNYLIHARVQPPRRLSAETTVELQTSQPGTRILIFELSRYLQVQEVTADGQSLEVVQNQALEGTALSRRGNDLVAVVFPAALAPGKIAHLRFVYAGEVLSDAGSGLLTVGARGIWYPNRGTAMSGFDMEFRYPAGWTLVASGEPAPGERGQPARTPAPAADPQPSTEQVIRYVAERPLPFAGFNLGRYVKTTLQSGNVLIEAYAAAGVEQSLPRPESLAVTPPPIPFSSHSPRIPTVEAIPAPQPQPQLQAKKLTQNAAATVGFLASHLGAFPYRTLALTQMPGFDSQGWPGLINLSSLSFLSRDERVRLRVNDPFLELLYSRLMPAHEVAHQWWGDLVTWKSYREQWLVEALANYCVLLMIEQQEPAAFRVAMEQYRHDLLKHNADGRIISDAGPVTLGQRLNSSHFPKAYEAISYERGTWLFHMLRAMLVDAQTMEHNRGAVGDQNNPAKEEDPFFAVLRSLREHYAGKAINTRDVQQAFEEALPESLRYEGRKSLEWFFDDWVNGSAVPTFELMGARIVRGESGTTATGKVIQKLAPKDLVTSVPLYADIPGQRPVLLGRIFAEGEATPFHFKVPPQTRRILLDPYDAMLSRP